MHRVMPHASFLDKTKCLVKPVGVRVAYQNTQVNPFEPELLERSRKKSADSFFSVTSPLILPNVNPQPCFLALGIYLA